MQPDSEGAKNYFDRIPEEWQGRYSSDNRLKKAFDRIFRAAVFQRRRLTFERCGPVAGASVLDIGCGTGLYGIEFARFGASRVLGIDFAPSMIAFSRRMAAKVGVSERCEFLCADFASLNLRESFDIVLGLGLFDYIAEPEPMFKKIAGLTKGRFLASFPSSSRLWMIQRRIRYNWIKRCPVYDYTGEKLELLCADADFSRWDIVPIKRGLFVVAENQK